MLDLLEHQIADDLESQQLDFKQWIERSLEDNIKLMIKMAVCMANGGGGSIVFGVADKVKGRTNAIIGIPLEIDATVLQKRIYEKTDPHLTVYFEDIQVPEGTQRLLAMNVFPGMPPYTTTDGSATIRQGKDCLPFTGTLRRQMIEASSEMDMTAELVFENWKDLFSPSAMERVRELMAKDNLSNPLLALNDEDLLVSIGALKNGYFTKGALLLVGTPAAITRVIPQHRWSYRKMTNDVEYTVRDDGTHALPVALYELERYIATDNPIVTIESGLVHPEYSTYPTLALREALLNALGHRDYRIPGTIMLKQYPDKLILTNPGRFIGGITEKNILHHPPVTRNDHLMDLLDKLKLVNRSNLGVSRIYRSLLVEGKEPPIYREVGNNIELTFISSSFKKGFKSIVDALIQEGKPVDVDHLLILQYLLRHEEIDTTVAASVAQRSVEQARELLSKLNKDFNLIEPIGRGKGRYYTLTRYAYSLLEADMKYERQQVLDKEAVKMRVLTILKERPLSNKEIRQMTSLNDKQVQRLIKELASDGVSVTGRGAGTRYILNNTDNNTDI